VTEPFLLTALNPSWLPSIQKRCNIPYTTTGRSAEEFAFEAEVWPEGGQYVARANPLNVMSCGDTRQQALDALSEAVELFLETAQEMGTLDALLEEAGYVAQGVWGVNDE
jgi:predicted RNase H-like HicB family nuclease